MIFTETRLKGAFIIEPEKKEDERGFFARAYCQNEFVQHGLAAHFVQCNIAFNKAKGTLRGMHYQAHPYEEVKLVRCTMGTVYDVIIDLRQGSPTYKQWIAVELSAWNRKMLYVPENFAHGYQTLADETEVYYQVSEFYTPQFERGVRWNDPAFEIKWPEASSPILSDKDKRFLDYVP